MKWLPLFGITFFQAILLFGQTQPQQITFEQVQRASDDPGGAIAAMTQDPAGFLWFATEHGVYRYDGHRYVSYHNEPLNPHSIAADRIWCIAADTQGYIWMSPSGAGLDKLDPASGMATHYKHIAGDPHSIVNDTVTCIYADKAGKVWIGTATHGLDCFDPSTNRFSHYQHNPKDVTTISCNAVRVIYEDHEGVIWIGGGNEYYGQNPDGDLAGGLNKLDRRTGRFTRYVHDENDPKSLIDNRVHTIFEDSRGSFWIGTAGDGLHTMDRRRGTFERHRYDPIHPEQLSRPPLNDKLFYVTDHISFIQEDAKGNIWIGTFEGGMNIFDPVSRRCKSYTQGVDILSRPGALGYWSAFKTKDNVIWLGTRENHLFKSIPYRIELTRTRIGKAVTSFRQDNNRQLWIGTERGLLHRLDNGTNESFMLDKDSSSLGNIILGMERIGDDLWLATPKGLHRFNMVSKSTMGYYRKDRIAGSLYCDTVEAVKKGVGNTLWIAEENGADVLDIATETFTHYLYPAAANDSVIVVTDVALDKKANVWFGTQIGLFRKDAVDGNIKRFLPSLHVYYTLQDKFGDIWSGTNEGLFRYDKTNDNFIKHREFYSLGNMPSWTGGLTEDHLGQLWFVCASGIVKLDTSRTQATLFGRNQGVNSLASTYVGYTTTDGKVLYADTAGYVTIDPNQVDIYRVPPVVMVTDFFINNEARPLQKKIALSYDEATFSIRFASIDFFSKHEDTRLLFQLDGYDNEWRQAGDERTARYFNLPPGAYTFRARSINSAGIKSDTMIALTISPPWWKTWWAYGVLFCAIGALVYFIYYSRIRQLKRKQTDQMHIMVATQEGERKRISRDLHDDIGTKLSALKLSLSSLQEKASVSGDRAVAQLSANASQTITEVMQDVRQLLINLSPVTLESFGYTVAVETLVNKINETKQIHFDLVLFGMKQRMTSDYELALYRITQELINNVLKHAAAKNVSLQIGQRDGKIILMIEDDGTGFDVNEHTRGFGLYNLDARTKLLDGTMTIDSHPGKGTSILVEIPYNVQVA